MGIGLKTREERGPRLAHVLVERGKRAWSEALVEARRPESIALGVIVLIGLFLRVYFSLRWRPALLGYPDSAIYISSAHLGLFGNQLRVDGYGEFLRLMHFLRPHLSFAIRVQHLLGICSGLLLYGAMRRAGLPRWLGLIPAAIVILSGDELFIEHTPLSEPVFTFLIALAMYAAVRAWRGGWGWALLAGLSLGAATDVRTIGEVLTVVVIVVVGLIYAGSWRGRALRVALMAIAAAVPIGVYLQGHKDATGTFGFTTAGNIALYGRVGMFADCSKFTPPPGTRDLCIHVPLNQRGGPDDWELTSESPAVQVYGEPDITPAKPQEDARLESFAEAAILGQPLQYLKFVGRDLIRIVDPSYSASPYGNRGATGTGWGEGPAALTRYFLRTYIYAEEASDGYYTDPNVHHQGIGFLLTWERDTRIEGPFMAALLALALLSPLLAAGHRRAALLFLAAAIVLVVGPPFAIGYDYRYLIPAFGVLGCSAAVGAWGVYLQARRLAAPRLLARRGEQAA